MLPEKSEGISPVALSEVNLSLKNLVGPSIFEVSVGPCGFHVKFAPSKPDRYVQGMRTGAYSLFIACSFRIASPGVIHIQHVNAYDANNEELCAFLLGKKSIRAEVSPRTSALRLFLDSGCLLTAFPKEQRSGHAGFWGYYNHTTEPESGFIFSGTGMKRLKKEKGSVP